MALRRISTALGIVGLLVLPTAAQAAPASSGPGVAVRMAEPDAATFLRAAHQTNLAEIGAGRIAWGKSTDPTLKTLAASLMRDHIRMDADLYQAARRLRVYLPDAPTADQEALARRYEAAGADTFDEYFISTQLAGHRAALKMTSEQASTGTDSSVKALAAKAAPIIAGHQQMLRAAAKEEGLAGYVDTGGRQG